MSEESQELLSGGRPDVRRADPVALASGAGSVIVFLVIVLMLPTLAAAKDDPAGKGTGAQPFEYIEARILKLGEEKDDSKLPDREVPAMPTAPDEVLPLDTDENRAEPEEKEKPERQRDAVSDDKLREVFDRARAFAEIQDDYVPEGHPDGVPDGDVTDPALASMGATYGRRVVREIGVRYPTLLDEGTLKGLRAKVHIRVGADMRVIDFAFKKKSGNQLFDDAIQNSIDRLIAERRPLPDPPEAIAGAIFGGGIVITFHGRDGQYE